MATETVIAAASAIMGGAVTKILDHFLDGRSQNNTEKREFLHDLTDLSNKVLMAHDQYLSDFDSGDPISYDTASRCRSRTPDSKIRKYNINRPDVISDSFITDLREWQSIAWKLDDLDIWSRSNWDPNGRSESEEYLQLMSELYAKSEEINEKSITQLE